MQNSHQLKKDLHDHIKNSKESQKIKKRILDRKEYQKEYARRWREQHVLKDGIWVLRKIRASQDSLKAAGTRYFPGEDDPPKPLKPKE